MLKSVHDFGLSVCRLSCCNFYNYNRFSMELIYAAEVCYDMLASENRVRSIYSSFTGTLRRYRLYYCLWEELFCVVF